MGRDSVVLLPDLTLGSVEAFTVLAAVLEAGVFLTNVFKTHLECWKLCRFCIFRTIVPAERCCDVSGRERLRAAGENCLWAKRLREAIDSIAAFRANWELRFEGDGLRGGIELFWANSVSADGVLPKLLNFRHS